MENMIEKNVFYADTSTFKIIAAVFLILVLIPIFFVMLFIEKSFGGVVIATLLMTPCVSLLFSEEKIFFYKDRVVVASRYFFYNKIREYNVADFQTIKCKFGGQFNGVGSTTTKSLGLCMVPQGSSKFNQGELNLSSFFLWGIRDISSKNKSEVITEIAMILTEISGVTKLKIELDGFSESWLLASLDQDILFKNKKDSRLT
jgi:hypothetical protein